MTFSEKLIIIFTSSQWRIYQMTRRKKEISIHLVAERAGVSVATVSRVVNNRTDVSETLRRRIRTVISELNFSPNKGTERVSHIGVIVSTEFPALAEYTSQIINGMTGYAKTHHSVEMSIIMDCGEVDGQALIRLSRTRRCDALCLVMADRLLPALPMLERAGIPIMLINTPVQSGRMGYVNNDSNRGIREAMELLLQKGHRRIGFLPVGDDSSDNCRQRLSEYRDALLEIGGGKPEWVIPHIPTVHAQEAGYRQAVKLLTASPEITAILCGNDEMAMGCYRACYEFGRRIPDDVSIIGFDDLPFAGYLAPPLTTVRQPLSEMGRKALYYLDEYLQRNRSDLPGEILPTELIIRQSVGTVNQEKR